MPLIEIVVPFFDSFRAMKVLSFQVDENEESQFLEGVLSSDENVSFYAEFVYLPYLRDSSVLKNLLAKKILCKDGLVLKHFLTDPRVMGLSHTFSLTIAKSEESC